MSMRLQMNANWIKIFFGTERSKYLRTENLLCNFIEKVEPHKCFELSLVHHQGRWQKFSRDRGPTNKNTEK